VPQSTAKNIFSGFFEELQNEWNNFALGRFSANLFLLFGQAQPQTMEKNLNFWVIPWRVIICFLIVLAVMISTLIKLIKAYNRWIIRKATKSSF